MMCSTVVGVIHKLTVDEFVDHANTPTTCWRNFLSPKCRNYSLDPDHAHLGDSQSTLNVANSYRKSEVTSFSLSRDISRGIKFQKGPCDPDPFRDGFLSADWDLLWSTYVPNLKSLGACISGITKLWMAVQNAEYRVVRGQSSSWAQFNRVHNYDFFPNCTRNYAATSYRFQDIACYLSSHRFSPIHLHLALPLLGMPGRISLNLWQKKTRVPGLSCGVVCVILCLAVLV